MSRAREVLAGSGRLMLALGLAKALDFVVWIALARELGVESFGRYVGAVAFVLLFSTFADLGLTPIFAREAACGRLSIGLLRRVLVLKVALALLTVGLAAILTTVSRPDTLDLTLWLSAGLVLNSLAQVFEAWLKAEGRPGSAGLSGTAQSAAGAAVALGLLAADFGPLAGAVAVCIGGAVHLVVAACRARRPIEIAVPNSGSIGTLLSEAMPVALSGLCVGIYFRIDAVLLTHMEGDRAAGLYGGAYRFFEAGAYVSAAFRSVLYPVLARTALDAPEVFSAHLRRTVRGLLFGTIGVAAAVWSFAPVCIGIVLGQEYAEAAGALAWLVWALPSAFVADTLFHALVASHRARSAARAVAVAAVLNIVLNVALIPILSYRGAALATVGSEVLSCVLLARAMGAGQEAVLDFRTLRWPLGLGAIAIVAFTILARLLGTSPAAPWAAVTCVAVWFALAARWGLPAQDRAVLRSLIPSFAR